ncbi:hypothetical protein ACFLWZ_08435 [Chloroflexota bacterium]
MPDIHWMKRTRWTEEGCLQANHAGTDPAAYDLNGLIQLVFAPTLQYLEGRVLHEANNFSGICMRAAADFDHAYQSQMQKSVDKASSKLGELMQRLMDNLINGGNVCVETRSKKLQHSKLSHA